jgi:hypothetical protein
MLLLSASNTSYQVRSSLRLITAIVTSCGQAAKEVMLKLDFEHKHWETVAKRNSPEIRKSFVQFLLSFFIINHAGVAKEFLEKKSLLGSIFPGLMYDECETVELVVSAFKSKILENAALSKTAKMKLFSVHSLKYLLALFEWRGPTTKKEQSSEDVIKEDKLAVSEVVKDFFMTALTSVKLGLIFHDPSYGTSGSNHNHLMFNLIQGIQTPWSNPQLAKLVIGALGTCPDQLRPYISKVLQHLWEPRASDNWFQVVDFLYSIMQSLDMNKIIGNMSDYGNNKHLTTVVSNFCCNEKIHREVILESLKSEESVVRLKGIELQALILNKLDQVLKSGSSVSNSSKKQILFRLLDKLPTLEQVSKLWQEQAVQTVTADGEDEVMPEETSVQTNYLLSITQVLSFYLTYLPDKYSHSDLDLRSMLQQISKSQLDKEGLVQLLLLKHLLDSHQAVTSVDHLNTLISIACQKFGDENGKLALDALYSLLARYDLCQNKQELKVWLAFVNVDKMDKVGQLLAETLQNVLEKKEVIGDEIKKASATWDVVPSSRGVAPATGAQATNDLLEKLLQPHFTTEDNAGLQKKTNECGVFKPNPVTWEFIHCKALMHHKAYFVKCVTAQVLVQEDPKAFLQFLMSQDLRSFKEIKALTAEGLATVEVPKSCDEVFNQRLNMMHKLCLFKLDPGANQDVLGQLEALLQEEDCAMLLMDKSLLKMFDPLQMESDSLTNLLVNLFKKQNLGDTLMTPYSAKTLDLINGALDCDRQVECANLKVVLEALPITTEDLFKLVSRIAKESKTSLFALQVVMECLRKVQKEDKWSLATSIEECSLHFLAQVLETMLSDCDFVDEIPINLLQLLTKVIGINDSFCKLITVTHISLACQSNNDNAINLVTVLVKNDCKKHGGSFKKWMTKNMDAVDLTKYQETLQCLLNSQDGVKSKFIKQLSNHIMQQESLELFEDLLEILVSKYQVDISDCIDKLQPCRALLLHLQNTESPSKVLITSVVVPSIKKISTLLKTPENMLVLDMSKTCSLVLDCNADKLSSSKVFMAEWPAFVKTVLKHSLKEDHHAEVLEVLKVLCESVLKGKESNSQAELIYSLICGHSLFVPTLFSTSSLTSGGCRKKEALLDLVLTLTKANPSICSGVQVPIYLGAYGASLSKADQLLLEILYIHETEGSVSLQAFKPLVWGQAAVAKFSVLKKSSTTRTKVSKITKTSEVLALIQPDKMIQSALQFPMSFETFPVVTNDNYDPRFFLPLLCQVCSPGNFVDKHLKLVESGGLALAFASLSCRDSHVRTLGLVTLSRIYQQLQSARKSLSAEKQVWLHLVDLVRNGLLSVLEDRQDKTPPRIPHLATAFLVKASKILSNPLDSMFKSVSSFVLAKPMMDLFSVPEFLRLFHSSDVTNHGCEQLWILGVISNGLRNDLDYGILQQNFVLKMIMSYYDSSMAAAQDSSSIRTHILDIVEAICALPSPAVEMIRQHGLLIWLLEKDQDSNKLIAILQALWTSTKTNLNSQTIMEMLALTLKLLAKTSNVEGLKILLPILVDLASKLDLSLRNQLINLQDIRKQASNAKDETVDEHLHSLFKLLVS